MQGSENFLVKKNSRATRVREETRLVYILLLVAAHVESEDLHIHMLNMAEVVEDQKL